jgi:hypothetical protein
LWSNGKIVPEQIPEAWRLLDDTRFYLLKKAAGSAPPSSASLYGNPILLQSYQLLSAAASEVLTEYLRSKISVAVSELDEQVGRDQCLGRPPTPCPPPGTHPAK